MYDSPSPWCHNLTIILCCYCYVILLNFMISIFINNCLIIRVFVEKWKGHSLACAPGRPPPPPQDAERDGQRFNCPPSLINESRDMPNDILDENRLGRGTCS